MKNFDRIANDILAGVCCGVFKLRNKEQIHSNELSYNTCPIMGYDYPYVLGRNGKTYSLSGNYCYGKETPFDVVDFIKDKEN